MKNVIREECEHYEKYMGITNETTKKFFYYVQWAGIFKCKSNFYIQRQGFKSILLLQTIKGKGMLHYNGEKVVLQPGKFVLLDCMLPHVYFPLKNENWDFRFLHFSGARCYDILKHLYLLNGRVSFETTPQIEKNICFCIEKCETGIEEEIRISKAINDILYDCLMGQKKRDVFSDVLKYIEENYSRKINAQVLAQEFGISRCHFSTEFKKSTGKTVHDCILNERIFQAKKMLVFEEKTILEISEDVGFVDVGTFIKNFKKIEKMTPLQYRKQHKN